MANYATKIKVGGVTYIIKDSEAQAALNALLTNATGTTLAEKATDMSAALADLQADVDTNTADVATAKTNITTLQDDVTDLQTDVADAKDNIATLQTEVAGLGNTDLSNYVTYEAFDEALAHSVRIKRISDDVAELDNGLEDVPTTYLRKGQLTISMTPKLVAELVSENSPTIIVSANNTTHLRFIKDVEHVNVDTNDETDFDYGNSMFTINAGSCDYCVVFKTIQNNKTHLSVFCYAYTNNKPISLQADVTDTFFILNAADEYITVDTLNEIKNEIDWRTIGTTGFMTILPKTDITADNGFVLPQNSIITINRYCEADTDSSTDNYWCMHGVGVNHDGSMFTVTLTYNSDIDTGVYADNWTINGYSVGGGSSSVDLSVYVTHNELDTLSNRLNDLNNELNNSLDEKQDSLYFYSEEDASIITIDGVQNVIQDYSNTNIPTVHAVRYLLSYVDEEGIKQPINGITNSISRIGGGSFVENETETTPTTNAVAVALNGVLAIKQDKLSYYDDDSNEVSINSVDTEITDGSTTSVPTTQAVYDALQNISGGSGSSTVNVKYYTVDEIIEQYSINGEDTTSPIFVDDEGNEWQYEYDDSNSDGYQLWYMNHEDNTPPTVPLRLKENGEQDVETALRETNKAVLERIKSETYNEDKTTIEGRIETNRIAIENLPVSKSTNYSFGTSANQTDWNVGGDNMNVSRPSSIDDSPLYIFVAIENVGIYAKKLTYSDFLSIGINGTMTWTVNSNLTLKFVYNYYSITSILVTNTESLSACVTFYKPDYSDNAIGQAMVDMLYNQYKTE